MKNLKNLWIMRDSGIVVFEKVFKEKISAQLFGGLVSAIHTLSGEIIDGEIENLTVGDEKYSFNKKNNFFFVANYPKSAKEKLVKREVKKIINTFFDKYPLELLETFQSDITIFRDFEYEIEDTKKDTKKDKILEKPIGKFWNISRKVLINEVEKKDF